MARPLRILFNGAWYHVMNRGANHQEIFFDDNDKRMFLSIFADLTAVYGVEVHAYCLMSNHYHLVIHTPRGNLSEAMRYLNSRYTQCINARWQRDGALFRGRYKAILIGADDYLLKVSRYIHLNPVKAKIVKMPFKYPWSSYAYYIDSKSPPSWLILREIKKRFGVKKFVSRYKNYVEQGDDKELEDFYASGKMNPILGDKNFREMIFERIKSHSLSAEIVGADEIIAPPSIDTILSEVASYYQVKISSITHSAKRSSNARKAAMYLCRQVGGYSLNEISERMGGIKYVAISKSIKRSREHINIMKEIKIIEKKLLLDAKRVCEQGSL